MAGLSVISTFLNALTVEGLLDLWTLGWMGFGASPPDTAAMILKPSNLLSGPVLSSLKLSDLTLDPSTYTSIDGLIQVEAAGTTGLIVASWSVPLQIPVNTQPVGMALFNNINERLWYVSAFSNWPAEFAGLFTWNAKVTLNTPCQGS